MTDQDRFLRSGFALFSALTSFLFIFYAVNIVVGGDADQWQKAFAYVAGGYGLANIYVLSWAWRNRAEWPLWANKFFALCFFGVFIVDKLSQGIENLMEVAGIAGLAAVLWINWYALKKLCRREDA